MSKSVKNLKSVALEDLVTLVITEFLKNHKRVVLRKIFENDDFDRIPYLNKNKAQRNKISEKIIESIVPKNFKKGSKFVLTIL